MKLIKLFVALFFYCLSLPVLAQNGNSPYSRFGLGELAVQGSIYNIGMGGIGVAASSQAYATTINPALLARNKLTFFEASFWLESKNLVTEKDLQRTQTGNLGSLAFGFPVARKVTIGAGLAPYSLVNYNNKSEEQIGNTTAFVEYSYIGSGGINNAYLSAGWNVWKQLYVGARMNYNFGAIKNQSQSFVNDGLSNYKVQLLDQTNVHDVSFKLGTAYRINVGKDKNFNIGATWDVGTKLGVTNFQARQRLSRFDVLLSTDTVKNDVSNSIYLPSKYQFGISFERPFNYLVGVDISMQNWQEFTGIKAVGLTDTYKFAVGGEWTPNASSIDNYFARVAYRIGFNYSILPVKLRNTQLDERSVSLGFSLPMMRGISSTNIALVLGQRGTLANELIQENFFRFNLGLTVNDQWFVRRRIN
jgi:hypothetical protein